MPFDSMPNVQISVSGSLSVSNSHILNLTVYRAESLLPGSIPIYQSSLVNADNDFDPDSDYGKNISSAICSGSVLTP